MDSGQAPPQIFELDYYQRLYDIEEQHGWAQGLRDAMDALFKPAMAGRTDLRVLDVGCGTGLLMEYVHRYPIQGQVVGVDISPYALQFCRQRGQPELALASAVTMPFAANVFDLVVCIDTIQHLSPASADQVAIAEFARLLRPGGLLYLRTNSKRGHPLLTGADPDQYRRYDLDTVNRMLTISSLKVLRATYLNAIPGFYAMLGEYARARRKVVKPIGPGLSIQLHPPNRAWVNRLIRSVLSVEAWMIGSLGLNLAFGHSTAFLAQKEA